MGNDEWRGGERATMYMSREIIKQVCSYLILLYKKTSTSFRKVPRQENNILDKNGIQK